VCLVPKDQGRQHTRKMSVTSFQEKMEIQSRDGHSSLRRSMAHPVPPIPVTCTSDGLYYTWKLIPRHTGYSPRPPGRCWLPVSTMLPSNWITGMVPSLPMLPNEQVGCTDTTIRGGIQLGPRTLSRFTRETGTGHIHESPHEATAGIAGVSLPGSGYGRRSGSDTEARYPRKPRTHPR
jgi:hypothetical protein